MATATAASVESAGFAGGISKRVLRLLKAQVEDWYDVCRQFSAWEDGHLIDEALTQGARDAMLRHKAAGLPVVIYRDGKTVWVKPEDLGF